MPEPITQAPTTEVEKPNAVESRIAELTAKAGESERQRLATEQQLNELKLKYENMANGVAASLGVAPTNQQPNVDPNLKAAIEAALAPVMNEFRQTVGNLRMSESQRALQEAYQKNAVPDAVKKKAQEIYDTYAKQGVILKDDVVVNQAWGIVAREEHLKSIQANTNRQSFNMPYANMGNGYSTSLNTTATIEKPANFDSLSAREQVQWYEKNVGDKPL